MTFRVGQRVVCIAEGHGPILLGEVNAIVGAIYTVRKISEYGGQIGLYLSEIINPPQHTIDGLIERGMYSERFRPIVERKTDISIFTKMLTDKRVDA